MENKIKEVRELSMGWRKLRIELRKNKKVDFALFEDIFSKTYALLSQHAADTTIDKKYAELISVAYLFANTENREFNNRLRAALVLTERMISCCVFSGACEVLEGTIVYIFEARRDVYLNFGNVSESIETLEALFEEDFWRSL